MIVLDQTTKGEETHPGHLPTDGVAQAAAEAEVKAGQDAKVKGLPPVHSNCVNACFQQPELIAPSMVYSNGSEF